MKQRLATVSLLAPILTLAACAASVETEAMVPEAMHVVVQHPGTVRLVAHGTPRRMLVGRRRIHGESLGQSLEDAIESCDVFSSVVRPDDAADYQIEVEVLKVKEPDMGLEMEAAVEMRWTLTEVESGDRLWSATLETEGQADPDDSDDVSERSRIAIENAVRANLRLGIETIGQLDI
jgi:hypothetical protein